VPVSGREIYGFNIVFIQNYTGVVKLVLYVRDVNDGA
jgi:hypothetical protein